MAPLFGQPLAQLGVMLAFHHRAQPVLVVFDAAEVAAPT